MRLPVHASRLAEQDLAEHARYLAERDPRLAARIFAGFERIVALISENPGMGVRRRFRRAGELRVLPVPGFREWLVFYREEPDRLFIVRILHAKRDIAALLSAPEQ